MAHLLNLSSKPISRLLKSVVSNTSDSLPALFDSVSQTTPIIVVSDGGAQLNAALRVLRLAGLSVIAVRSAGGTVENLPDGIVQIDDSDGLAAVLEAAEDVLQASSATKPLRLQVLSSDPEACQVFCLSGKPVADVALRVLPAGAPNQIVAVREFQSGLYDVQVSDCSVPKGAILSNEEQPAELSDQFSVQVAWFGTEPLFSGRTYLFEQLGQAVSGTVTGIKFRVDSHSKTEHAAAGSLKQDEVGEVTINLERDIVFDPIDVCPQLGRLIIRDPVDQKVLGVAAIRFALRRAQNVHKQALVIDRAARESLNGHKGRVIWFTGLSGSGKSTVANAVEQALHEQGTRTYILDGDNVRHGLNKDLGFTDADRVENIRRIAEVAKLMVDAGLVVLTAFISPFRSERDMARAMFAEGEFVEVFVDVPLSVAEDRDPKGLYKKARRGELPNFTGIDSDYEAPESAEIVIRTDQGSVDECAQRVLGFLN